MALEPWETWAKRVRVRGKPGPPEAKQLLEETVRSMGAPPTALPWHRFARKGAA